MTCSEADQDLDVRQEETPGPLKTYRRPEIRRYGRVSHGVFGGSGNAVEPGPKKSPKKRP